MPKGQDANSFGILLGSLISALLGVVLIVVLLVAPGLSLLLIAMILLPLIGVIFSTVLLWRRTHQRAVSIRRMQSGQCSKCEYDLTGNVSGVCPECGTPIPSETRVVEAKQSVRFD